MPKVDQRGFDNQPELLDSAQAAALLGVETRTLYAYASRGLIAPVRSGRRSRYARADLLRLKARHDARSGHGPVAAAALHWGEPVLPTGITAIGPDGPLYREHPATALARRGIPFLEVCQLLWTATPSAPSPLLAFSPSPRSAGERAGVRGLRPRTDAEPSPRPSPRGRGEGTLGRATRGRGTLSRSDPIVRLMHVALSGLAEQSAPFGLAPDAELARAHALLLAFACAAGPRAPRTRAADPATCLLESFGLPATPARRRLVDAALVLCADHELNASTFAARVAASTGADLQACLLAALATFMGPRHGTASRAVEDLLDEMGRPARAAALVRARTTAGLGMPGFGHPLYPQGDPRATALLAIVAETGARPRPLDALDAVIRATAELRGERPNIDAALVGVSLALGLPRGAATALFAVGRTAGWVAHVLEQRESPMILRPRARYLPRTPGITA
jgi:citrate synthase